MCGTLKTWPIWLPTACLCTRGALALRAAAQLQIDATLILRCDCSAPGSAARVWRATRVFASSAEELGGSALASLRAPTRAAAATPSSSSLAASSAELAPRGARDERADVAAEEWQQLRAQVRLLADAVEATRVEQERCSGIIESLRADLDQLALRLHGLHHQVGLGQ